MVPENLPFYARFKGHIEKRTGMLLIFLIAGALLTAQQIPDTTFRPFIHNPVYAPGEGPVVFIDEAHHNFHTKDNRYRAFADLLERDGYVVKAYTGAFEREKLDEGKILVISNALNEINVEDWYLPTPSAFTKKEMKELKRWVARGGSLFLIADHMPMAGAASDLAAKFRFGFTNGFVADTATGGPAFFHLSDGTLIGSTITTGREPEESVEKIATFTGQGFSIPNAATPILVFKDNYVNLQPDTAWVFDETTTITNAEGLSQGAYRTYRRGKVVAFGEAAMFTSQLAGPQHIRVGMSMDIANENYQLLLNIIHWLDGILE